MQGYSPRTLGRFLKKAPQKLFHRLVRANIVRDKSKFEEIFLTNFQYMKKHLQKLKKDDILTLSNAK